VTALPAPFSVRVLAQSDRHVRVVVVGELDLATAEKLDDALAAQMARHRHVLLDLSELTFMDSTGVTVLLNAIGAAKLNGWNLGISDALTAPVRRVLHLTGAEAILPLVEE
jgi:anti-sigma B factor antagonist